MHCYFAYGLRIRSALALPELTPGAGLPAGSEDVTIRFGPVQPLPSPLDRSGFGFWAAGDDACHVLDKVGAFLVRGGHEIVVDAAPGVEDRVLRLSVLGPALGLLLHQRGFLVLHASVVARSGDALAFLGNNGWGKSTIAAALHAKGYDLVVDDVAAIAIDEGQPRVLPGFPQVKLWPEAATLLGEDPERLPLLHPSFDKRGWPAGRGFALGPRRLERIYVITPGSTPAIDRLGPREACFELMTHWYGHRFGGGLLQNTSAARHLRQCVALAGQVPVQRLRRSGGSRSLLNLADLVDDDLRGDAGPSRRHEHEGLGPGPVGMTSNDR
jgi:hypothetical protein